jgi:hypothetical protein
MVRLNPGISKRKAIPRLRTGILHTGYGKQHLKPGEEHAEASFILVSLMIHGRSYYTCSHRSVAPAGSPKPT